MSIEEKNIRVCQVLHGIVGGGSEQVVLNYCSRMRDIHFDLLYQYEPNPQILERFNEAGINCIQIPDKVHHPLKHLWTMYKIFRQGKYDVVHCHLDWFLNSYVCFVAMLAGIKKRIAHHHQAYSVRSLSQAEGSKIRLVSLPNYSMSFQALTRNLICFVMRIPCKMFATHWLACSGAAAIDGWGNGAAKNGKVTILPNAIDPERFKFSEKIRQEVRTRYGIKDDDFVIGHVGRFYPQKNHDFLIDVFCEVHKQNPCAKLLLLGDGPLQEKTRQKIEALGLAESVIFAGLQKDPAPFYSAMDVFCFPSLWEGLGIVLLEAQYNGLPCVVSNAIPKEVLISNLLTYTFFDVDEWKRNVFLLVDMRKRNVEITCDAFDIKYCVEKLRMLYV